MPCRPFATFEPFCASTQTSTCPPNPLLLLQGGWRNQIRGMLALEIAYSPIAHAHNIRAPVLYLGGTHDRVLPLELLKQAANKTPASRMFIVRAEF